MSCKNHVIYCPTKDKTVKISVTLIDCSSFEDSSPKYELGTKYCSDNDDGCIHNDCVMRKLYKR